MKRTLASAILLVSVLLNLCAIPAQHKLFPIQQPDGSTVMLYKNGDRGLAFYTTPEDKVVIRDACGFLCYAMAGEEGYVATGMRVHDELQRSEEEREFVSTKAIDPYSYPEITEKLMPLRSPLKSHYSQTEDGLGEYGESALGAVPSIGEVDIPVIMVEFQDKEFLPTTTPEFMQRYYTEDGFDGATDGTYHSAGSVKEYFIDQSFGKFDPEMIVVAKVKLSQNYAYYGQNSNGADKNVFAMIKEAVKLAKEQGVDFSKFQSATDGKIPLVSILYAGMGEATGGDENTIWPHEYDYNMYNGTFEGFTWGSYFVGNELLDRTRIMGMGTFVHEFGHAIGLPDYYPTTKKYKKDDPFGTWDVMDGGGYVANTYVPVGFTAHERSYLGWLKIPELGGKEECVTLQDPNSETEAKIAVLVRNPNDKKEYFIFENRQPGTWYPYKSGSGLLVTRYAYDKLEWNNNRLNDDQNNKRAMVVTANGAKISDGLPGHLFGNGIADRTEFTLFNGTKLEIPMYQVQKRSNGTVSFCYGKRNLYEETEKNGEFFEKVSKIENLANNDTVIFVNEDENTAMSKDQYMTHRGTTTVVREGGKVYGNSRVQKVTMVKLDNGTWGMKVVTDGSTGILSADKDGQLLTKTKTDSNCFANITITEDGAEIQFTTTYAAGTLGYATDNTRFACFDNADAHKMHIYRKTGGTDGVETVSAVAQSASNSICNLAGQKVADTYRGVVIVNGKKIIR